MCGWVKQDFNLFFQTKPSPKHESDSSELGSVSHFYMSMRVIPVSLGPENRSSVSHFYLSMRVNPVSLST